MGKKELEHYFAMQFNGLMVLDEKNYKPQYKWIELWYELVAAEFGMSPNIKFDIPPKKGDVIEVTITNGPNQFIHLGKFTIKE